VSVVGVVPARQIGRFLGHERHSAVAHRLVPTRTRIRTRHHSVGSSTGLGVYGVRRYDVRMPADSTTGKRFHVATLPVQDASTRQVIASLLAAGSPGVVGGGCWGLFRRRFRPRRGEPCAFIERPARERSTSRSTVRMAANRCARLVVPVYGDRLRRRARPPPARSRCVVGFKLGKVHCRASSCAVRKPSVVSRTCSSSPSCSRSRLWALRAFSYFCYLACAFCAIPSFRGKQRSRLAP